MRIRFFGINYFQRIYPSPMSYQSYYQGDDKADYQYGGQWNVNLNVLFFNADVTG